MFLGDAGSGNLNPVRRREGKVDWRVVNEDNKREVERGKGVERVDEKERMKGG